MELPSHSCRCCGKQFAPVPVLTYRNMPAKAQNFPLAEALDEDKGIDLDILQCPHCGLIQIGGEPVDYYRDVLRAVGISEEMKDFRREYFRDFVSKFELWNGRIIEIGAGCGEYAELFAELGVDVQGLEHRAESVAAGRKKGVQMLQGFVENAGTEIPGGPYDAFYTMSFLEHIPDPNEFLKGIANGIKEDGVGIVEVPSGDFILKNHLFSEFMLDHLSYFTEGTLRFLLEKNGFQVLSCDSIWNDYILSAVVRKRTISAQWDRFQNRQNELVRAIRAYADKVWGAGGRLAVWGAGHQALALLSLAELKDRVTCVIDSALFKQGRYTPATHIPVAAPECIQSEGIDAVLIMAGSYAQEIVSIMRKSWPRVDIAVVGEDGVTELGGRSAVKGNVLVTGCTGVTGNALVRHLLSLGLCVTAVVRPGSPRRGFLPNHPKLEVVECGLGRYEELPQKTRGSYQAFFHLAWDGSRGKEKTDLRNHMPMQLKNAGHVLEAVEACHGLGCPVFLAAGSQAEYGSGTGIVDEATACKPGTGYGAAKVCASAMASILCRQYGIRFIWARLFSVFGPWDATHSMIDMAVTQLLKGESPAYSAGEQMWNYLYSLDAAKALTLLAFAERAEGVYCVASQKSRPLKEYIAELHDVVAPGRSPRLGALPSPGNSSARMEVDVRRLVKDTGFFEEHSFRQGVAAVRDWYIQDGEHQALL